MDLAIVKKGANESDGIVIFVQDMMLPACRAATAMALRRTAVGGEACWRQLRFCSGDNANSHDDFKPVVKAADVAQPVQDHIQKDIKENSVMVYMKGIPEAPQCGFSALVVRILNEYDVSYKSRNVLADPELRNGIKAYSKWPTIPQIYVNGEFVGGSDILMNMHKAGELEALFKEAGVLKE